MTAPSGPAPTGGARFIPLSSLVQGTAPSMPNQPTQQSPGFPYFRAAGQAGGFGSLAANAFGYPDLGNAFGALGGGAGLIGGIQGGSPFSAAGGGIKLGSSLANAAGYPQVGGALGGLAGPLNIGSGIYNLTQGDISGVPSIMSGVGGLASLGGGLLGAANVAGLSGAGAAALAGGGAAGAAAAMGPMAAGLASFGAALGPLGAIAALGPLGHSLFKKGGIFSTAKNLPTAQEDSFRAGMQGVAQLGSALNGPGGSNLDGLTAILNTSFAPHGEVQIGSTMERYGWGGDWDDPAPPVWGQTLAAFRDPAQVNAGIPWAEDFIRNLWINGPGQTGDVPRNYPMTFGLQARMANALPNIPTYAGIKAAVAPGGDLYEKEVARVQREAEKYAAEQAEAARWQDVVASQYGPVSAP